MFLRKNRLGKVFLCLMLTMFLGLGSLIAIMPQSAEAATTSVTITKLASDKETVLAQKTVTYQWLRDSGEIEVMGDGVKHYYHQGPVFIDDPDPVEQERLRWNKEEDKNWDNKDMGAARGTNVIDLCEMVGGMKDGDKLRVKAADGLYRDFAYKNVYGYDINREGPMILTWETRWDKGVVDVETGYQDGMRLVWFAAATPKVGPTDILGLPSGDYHVFGNWDWHEAADPEYWYYYQDGSEKYPTTTGLSVKIISDLIIYSNEPVPEVPVADFTADTTSGTAPLTVNFTDYSIGTAPLTYEWDFDNDGTVDSTEQNPTYKYTEAGTYTVKLTVTNAKGSDSEVKTDYITVTEPVTPVADFTADKTSGSAPLTVKFTDQSTNSPTSWAWDFDNDGEVDSTEQNPTYEYSEVGTYSVKLTATNAAGSDDEVKTDYITVAAAGPKTWYVGKSGDVDYNTIQAAVTAASAGDTIIVKDGTYGENITVDKSLVIQSENGSDLTTVQAANTGADVFKVTAENVTIDGFTVSGATTRGKSGIAISATSGLPSGSCTIMNNKSSGNSQGISISNAKDNTISNNTCTLSGQYGIYLGTTSGNFITGNICSKNTAGSGYTLYLADNANNNTVSGNILDSNKYGIRVKAAHYNIIFNNTCSNNEYGLEIATKPANNVFYLNNFINNTKHISLGYNGIEGNIWNYETAMAYSYNGKQYNGFVGNYWGDYTGIDADGNGIGDTPYQIVGTDNDNYPLMGQWNNGVITGSAVATYTVIFEVTPEDATVVVKDSENVEVTAEADGTYELGAGEYTYTVSADGYVTKTDTITVSDKDETVTIALVEESVTPTTYKVTFAVTPENATVIVEDGDENIIEAETDGTYKLEAGEYSYIVSAEGYVTKTGTFTVANEAQIVTVVLEKVVVPETPQYNVIPANDAVYTVGATEDGIKTMTVNAGQTGLNYFTVSVESIKAHEGTETIVFTHFRNGVQLELNALVADFNEVNTAKAGFNVNPGDVVKVYIVDQLTNDANQNPVVFQ